MGDAGKGAGLGQTGFLQSPDDLQSGAILVMERYAETGRNALAGTRDGEQGHAGGAFMHARL